MLESIKGFLGTSKIKISQGIIWLLVLLDKVLLKLLGEKRYTWLIGYGNLTKVLIDAYFRRFKAYYDAHVDKESAYYKPIVKAWKVTAKAVLFVLIYLFVIETNIFWLTGEMPSVDDLQNPKLSQASEIYSADGVLLGKYFAENRTPLRDFNLLSPYLVKALVATEDARFYEHTGIDFQAWAGVIVGMAKGGDRGGGSTISQQLAKNLFKTRSKKGFVKTGLFGYIPGLSKLIYKS